MTDMEKRLVAAFSERDDQIEVDPQAWQTHLELTRGVAHTSVVRRWRSPVLVAAAVVSLGLLGGLLSQTGLTGLGTVSPAGPDSGSPAASPSGTTTAGASSSTPAGAASAPTRAPATGATPGSGGPVSSASRSTQVPTAQAPRMSTSMSGRGTELPARSAAVTTSLLPPSTSAPGPGSGSGPHPSAAASPVSSGAWSVTTSSASGQIALTGVVPCGARLPDLDSVAPHLTVEAGPDGHVVDDVTPVVPVLAVGYAVVTADGRIASTTTGDAHLTEATATSLAPGHSSRVHQTPLLPGGLCPRTADSTTMAATAQGPVFRTAASDRLPTGDYRATTVVLLGQDLAHARAYRAGDIWQLSTG